MYWIVILRLRIVSNAVRKKTQSHTSFLRNRVQPHSKEELSIIWLRTKLRVWGSAGIEVSGLAQFKVPVCINCISTRRQFRSRSAVIRMIRLHGVMRIAKKRLPRSTIPLDEPHTCVEMIVSENHAGREGTQNVLPLPRNRDK